MPNTKNLWHKYGNRGRLGASMNDTINFADPENPHFGTRIWDLSPMNPSCS